jgi:hypothetical protein
LVASVAAVVGASLLTLHQFPGAPPLTVYGSLASFTVLALWGVNYIMLTSRMAGERMAYMNRHLKNGEDTVAEEKDETPK